MSTASLSSVTHTRTAGSLSSSHTAAEEVRPGFQQRTLISGLGGSQGKGPSINYVTHF